MVNYSKCIIYKITTGDDIYIGSTTNYTRRKNSHKSCIYNENKRSYNIKLYQTIRANDGEWCMMPLKEFSCENKMQLTIEEQKCADEYKSTLNMRTCGTGIIRDEYIKQYREQNKDDIHKYQKQYYEINKDKKKQYREQNKDKILKHSKEKITCTYCGVCIRRSIIARHHKSKKCQKARETSIN